MKKIASSKLKTTCYYAIMVNKMKQMVKRQMNQNSQLIMNWIWGQKNLQHKLLVLSCSTGGGHNACGHYIEKEFKDNNITCDFADYFDIMGPKAKKWTQSYIK